jgi:SAM-dependent methyltransferase
MEQDGRTLAFYAAEAPIYAKAGDQKASAHLQEFLARLAAGARILELGCGGGRDSEAMIAAGFDVEPTDGCAELAGEASARLGRDVRVLRFDALAAEAEYDAVWANACLLHVPRAGLPAILARIHRALRPGGLFVATYKGGAREGRDSFGRLFNYLSGDALASLYRGSASWTKIDITSSVGRGYDQKITPWHRVAAQS